jgi:ligand-binding SRPBCC domain-containing protein
MATLRVWQHERVVEARGEDACQVTDRLAFELRRPLAAIPGAERLARAIVAALFRHRHRRLVAGAAAAGLR